MNERDFIEKLKRLDALSRGATTEGERRAADLAHERVSKRLEGLQADKEIEFRFSLHDPWARRLFQALARRQGLHPYRYRRQHRSTIMVRATEYAIKNELMPMFEKFERNLRQHLDEVTGRIIEGALGVSATEAEIVEGAEPPSLPSPQPGK